MELTNCHVEGQVKDVLFGRRVKWRKLKGGTTRGCQCNVCEEVHIEGLVQVAVVVRKGTAMSRWTLGLAMVTT